MDDYIKVKEGTYPRVIIEMPLLGYWIGQVLMITDLQDTEVGELLK